MVKGGEGAGGKAAGPKWGQSSRFRVCVCVCLLPRICQPLHCAIAFYIFAILFLLTPTKTTEAVCQRVSACVWVCVCVWACPAADESTFAFTQVTKHKRNETEPNEITNEAQKGKQKPKPRRRRGRGTLKGKGGKGNTGKVEFSREDYICVKIRHNRSTVGNSTSTPQQRERELLKPQTAAAWLKRARGERTARPTWRMRNENSLNPFWSWHRKLLIAQDNWLTDCD